MYIIEKNNVYELLNSLPGEVYAPICLSDGTVAYGKLNEGELTLANVLPLTSPKLALFPSTEEIMTFESNVPKLKEKSHTPIYLFGVRSCDVGALTFLDKFFCENFDFCDNFYYERRNRALIMALGSSEPLPNTFKTPTHTSSIAESGFDVQFIDLGTKYFVEIGSPKGEEFINNNRRFFKDATTDDCCQFFQAKVSARENLAHDIPIDEAISILLSNQEPEGFWKWIADRCIECGGCSYSCPTCTCFNVYDLVHSEESNTGVRCRSRDSCIFSGYTRETSGHNPRLRQEARAYRWYTHKLKTDIVNFGHTTCYGCGRCSSDCPGSMGIKRVIPELVRQVKEKKLRTAMVN